ncbi:MAG: hypothetical protein ABR613_06620 [Actinomycetota bacterium]
MNDIERRISALLHEEAHGAASPSHDMYRRVRHRAKVRRMVTATVTGVAAVAVVMGGVVTAGALRSPSTTQPVASSSESPTPGDREGDAKTEVAGGTVSGQRWALVAYEGDGGLCVDLQVGDGTSNVCGFDVPGQHDLGLNESSQREVSRTAIHGVVSKDVFELQVTLDGGEQIDVDIIESPAGFNVNFFAAFLPPDADAVVEARDSQGSLLESLQISPLPGRSR